MIKLDFASRLKNILRGMLDYRKTVFYLYKTKGFRAAYNFIYVKLFVVEGEGSWGLFYLFLRPLFKIFPSLSERLCPYPSNLEIEMTTICNKKCIMCEHTYWKKGEQEQRHLTFREFKKIVDQFPNLKWVNLTGEGDAFLNPDYLKMISYLKKRRVPIFLVDSFDLINKDIAEKLLDLGVDGIWMSIDAATKKTYNKIKVGCNFDRAIKNFKYMLDLKKKKGIPIPEFCFRYTINKFNVHEMPKFVELIASLGTREEFGPRSHIDFTGLLGFKETQHLFVEKIPNEILEETIKRSKELNIPISFSHIGKGKDLPPLHCCIAWYEPYILMGGYVMPCCSVLMSNKRPLLRKYAFGNLLEKPFREIWNSARYRKFRRMIPKKDGKVPVLCAGCRGYDTTKREKTYGVDTKT